MSDKREAYIEWLLNGRQGPNPNTPTHGIPKGEAYGGGPSEPRGVDYTPENMPVYPNRKMVPVAPIEGPAASAWMMVPEGIAARTAGAAIPAVAAHLIDPPQANVGEDEQMNAYIEAMLANKNASEARAQAPQSVDASGAVTLHDNYADPAQAVAPVVVSPAMKASVNKMKVSNAADQERGAVKNMEELRMRAREAQRKSIKQEMRRGR